MELDSSAGCVNFRDVGEYLSLLTDASPLPAGRLLRGGKLDFVETPADIGRPGTILNLRRGPERQTFGAQVLHLPAPNDLENYDTTNRRVRRWLNEVISVFEQGTLTFPVLVHCTSGKDRTGVVVAALLSILGTEPRWIVEEYLLSEGDVRAEWIQQALRGMTDLPRFFHGVDLATVRTTLTGHIPQ
ncbi:tyrosine-protein phosphatase [Deinococcus sp. KNUC1210]|uniref:tyrosine-protein phosphatase n=1 Tax=Deinococcus sp. KNUC1210 TaxID=2917691 RepID=UPI001EEFF208|nr:tyrosine-protein phosphatase [Deinococcus sp. KNUC1210]ULH15265.1 tyrosine-protein phosphatase [Deinococcus sp. KNUC1210]